MFSDFSSKLSWRYIFLAPLLVAIVSGCNTFPEVDKLWKNLTAKPSKPKELIVKGLSINRNKGNTVVTLSANAPFKYVAFKMQNPDRIALEVEGVGKVATKSLPDVSDELVKSVNLLRFDKSDDVRVEVALRKASSFDTSMNGSTLVLTISPDIPKAQSKSIKELATAKKTIAKLKKKITSLENKIKELESKRVVLNIEAPGAGTSLPENEKTLGAKRVPPVETAEDIALEKIKMKISAWLEAWRSQDILRYSEHYAASFSHKGMKRGRWLKSKERKFQLAGSIDVRIENIIVKILNKKAVVKFTQTYLTNGYNDTGNKTMTMSLIGQEWKIVSEKWSPVQ